MNEIHFPAAARSLRHNLGISKEEKLTIPNIAIAVKELQQQVQQEREAREKAEKAREKAEEAREETEEAWEETERERDQYKQHLSASLWLIAEYTNLPDQAENGNMAFGADEGVLKVHHMLKEMGKALGDVDILERYRFFRLQFDQAERERKGLDEQVKQVEHERDMALEDADEWSAAHDKQEARAEAAEREQRQNKLGEIQERASYFAHQTKVWAPRFSIPWTEATQFLEGVNNDLR